MGGFMEMEPEAIFAAALKVIGSENSSHIPDRDTISLLIGLFSRDIEIKIARRGNRQYSSPHAPVDFENSR